MCSCKYHVVGHGQPTALKLLASILKFEDELGNSFLLHIVLEHVCGKGNQFIPVKTHAVGTEVVKERVGHDIAVECNVMM